ncbi:MAG TPA: hypothetical protein PK239_12560 [Chitinophagales bacterium]|nr:hypothetical protein [Chitinophagales bacterium]
MKKTSLFILLFLAMTFLPPVGCTCPDLALETFEVWVAKNNPPYDIMSATDSVYLYLDLNWRTMPQANNFTTSNNSLYAWQCEEKLGSGLIDIRITSNQEFNGIPAGANLTDIFVCTKKQGLFIEDCLRETFKKGDYINYPGTSGIGFMFTQAPITAKEHVFMVRLTNDLSEHYSASSDTIRWQ